MLVFSGSSVYPTRIGENIGLSLSSLWRATSVPGGAIAIKFLLKIWILDDKQLWTCIPILVTGWGLRKLVGMSGTWLKIVSEVWSLPRMSDAYVAPCG